MHAYLPMIVYRLKNWKNLPKKRKFWLQEQACILFSFLNQVSVGLEHMVSHKRRPIAKIFKVHILNYHL